MLTNSHRAPCCYCRKPVGKRKGRTEKSATTHRWLVWHVKCEPEPPVPVPAAGEPAAPPYYLRD